MVEQTVRSQGVAIAISRRRVNVLSRRRSRPTDVFGILRPVIRATRNYLLNCLFAMMFVMLRTADAHAHLCFDGKEPPATFHIADGEAHPCETDPGNGHKGDKDVQLAPDALVKKPIPAEAWLPYVVIFVYQYTSESFGEPIVAPADTDAIRPPLVLLPPLRGPPV